MKSATRFAGYLLIQCKKNGSHARDKLVVPVKSFQSMGFDLQFTSPVLHLFKLIPPKRACHGVFSLGTFELSNLGKV